jgi:hypothetical protein
MLERLQRNIPPLKELIFSPLLKLQDTSKILVLVRREQFTDEFRIQHGLLAQA